MLIMLLALFLVTMFLGTPIAFSMSFASIVTNLTHGASSLMLTAQQCYDSTSNLSLLAVPFFMLAGSIMNMGGISRRLINFCRLFVGRIRGGLAIVAVLAAMIFAAISGSGPATVAALGVFMIPAMVNDGYDVGFAGALMGSAGGLGIIIPPSIPIHLRYAGWVFSGHHVLCWYRSWYHFGACHDDLCLYHCPQERLQARPCGCAYL